jgi:ABC-type multidrug transport system permease subunit
MFNGQTDAKTILLFMLKFLASVVVLFLMLSVFGFDPLGILIGLSNILLASLVYTIGFQLRAPQA